MNKIVPGNDANLRISRRAIEYGGGPRSRAREGDDDKMRASGCFEARACAFARIDGNGDSGLGGRQRAWAEEDLVD